MRTLFVPPSPHQLGNGAFPVYRGLPYQRGAGLGSVLRNVFRFLLPIGKQIAKTVGKQALRTGVDIASDVIDGQPVKLAAKRRVKTGSKAMLKKAGRK